MNNPDPLPRRIAWFAPWTWYAHWKPWKRWTLFAAVTLVAYVELPIFRFAVIMLEISGDSSIGVPRPIADGMYFACLPLFWCMENCEAADQFYSFQAEFVSAFIVKFF